ncbi:MAG TPA: cache domain-containing protein [Syntrophales bacterium]|jgi:cytochrome c|nr:cache domain-containing protein [Syntrophales bacterium]
MKRLVVVILVAGLLLGGATCALAKGTAKEAQAMVDKAIAYFQANGKAKAFAAFDDPKGQFVKDDLYIYVVDMKGDILSHGANKKLIGQHFIDIKDSNGKLFFREILDVGKTKGSGWVDYTWTNPVSKKIEPKSAYVKKSGEFIFCCGIYK